MKRMTVIFLIIASTNAGAQTGQTPDSVIPHFFTLYPIEQVYLQLDNSTYFPGDTVWFKAYVTDNGVPSLQAKSLYVDWFDGHDQRIAHQALALVDGMATAQYALPTGLIDKKVHVIAYTRWMLNDSSNFVFHKDILLIEQTNSKSRKGTAATLASFSELRFFPEGGSLITGVVNKVAFKAVRTDGSPAEVRGDIRDNEGHPIANFSSDHQGMGFFYLIPSPSSTYTAEWTDANGNGAISKTPLPSGRPNGIAMEVLTTLKERKVTLRRSAGLAGRYYLLGTFYGVVTYLAKIDLEVLDTAVCPIPIEGYPDGMLTLTVLDSAWTPLSERILFIPEQDSVALQSRIDLTIEQKGLSARGQNRILLHYTGAGAANLSIAATDAALPDDDTTGIAGYLPVSGQLKNRPPYAKQLFYDGGAKATENLDLLALTGEWKHNDWKAILTGQQQQNKYLPDTGYYSLSGKAVNAAGKGKNEPLSFLIKQRDFIAMDTLELTRNGLVNDRSMILFDTTWVQYRPEPHQKHYAFSFDQLSPAAWDKYPFPDEPEKFTTDQNQGSPTIAANTADLSKRFGKTLQTVTVTAAKRVSRMDSLENAYESDVRIRNSQGHLWDLHDEAPNTNFHFFLQLLADKVPDFPSKRYGGFHPPPISKYIYLVDENPVPYEALMQGVFPQVVFVKYFPAGQGAYGPYPLVAMYTEKHDYNPRMERAAANPNEYIVTGYTQSQPYDTATWQPGAAGTRAADLRRTLYWNPSIFVDEKNNSIQLRFTNNDLGGPIRIVVEGMDKEGNPIHLERIID